jgi:hypothetical protein
MDISSLRLLFNPVCRAGAVVVCFNADTIPTDARIGAFSHKRQVISVQSFLPPRASLMTDIILGPRDHIPAREGIEV